MKDLPPFDPAASFAPSVLPPRNPRPARAGW